MAITAAEVGVLARCAARKTRQAKGASHFRARLSDEEVRAMRELYAKWRAEGRRDGYESLARIFSCGWPTARDIVKGWTRRDAGGPMGPPRVYRKRAA